MNSAIEGMVPFGCLDDDAIAALVDGDVAGDPQRLAHVASCARCRDQLGSAAEAVNDPVIGAEMNAAERGQAGVRARPRRWVAASLVSVAAAAAMLVITGPLKTLRDSTPQPDSAQSHRDAAITSTVAPKILSPGVNATFSDSLRWTSVTGSDLYRIRVWNAAGDVLWSAESRDTVIAIPHELKANTPYLWEVDARTAWDRWVSSNFVEFTLHERSR